VCPTSTRRSLEVGDHGLELGATLELLRRAAGWRASTREGDEGRERRQEVVAAATDLDEPGEDHLSQALLGGLLEVRAKMGISVVRSYQSSKLLTPPACGRSSALEVRPSSGIGRSAWL